MIIDFSTRFKAIEERDQGLITACGACGNRLSGTIAHLACGHLVHQSCMESHRTNPRNLLPPSNPMVTTNVSCPRCGHGCSLWSELNIGGPEYSEQDATCCIS